MASITDPTAKMVWEAMDENPDMFLASSDGDNLLFTKRQVVVLCYVALRNENLSTEMKGVLYTLMSRAQSDIADMIDLD